MTKPQLLANTSFSTQLRTLQLAWDSTSIGLLKECPRKYQLSMCHHLDEAGNPIGYATRKESVHLTFGSLYHGACERYDHAKTAGSNHQEALRAALRWTLAETWEPELGRPWMSDDANKNRFTLIRTVVWYLDKFENDPIQTIVLANGKPAVELSFRLDTDVQTITGEKILICGHLDRLGALNDDVFILDRKTSKNTVNQDFFAKFSPDNQFSTYCFSGKVVYHQPIKGLIVDAAQVAVTFSRFERGFVWRTDDQLEEWYRDTMYWIGQAQHFAETRGTTPWPMNDKACNNYGGCPFRDICSKAPSVRDQWLTAAFVPRVWDPLQVRGDI